MPANKPTMDPSTNSKQTVKQELDAMTMEEYEVFLKKVAGSKSQEDLTEEDAKHAALLKQLEDQVKVQADEPLSDSNATSRTSGNNKYSSSLQSLDKKSSDPKNVTGHSNSFPASEPGTSRCPSKYSLNHSSTLQTINSTSSLNCVGIDSAGGGTLDDDEKSCKSNSRSGNSDSNPPRPIICPPLPLEYFFNERNPEVFNDYIEETKRLNKAPEPGPEIGSSLNSSISRLSGGRNDSSLQLSGEYPSVASLTTGGSSAPSLVGPAGKSTPNLQETIRSLTPNFTSNFTSPSVISKSPSEGSNAERTPRRGLTDRPSKKKVNKSLTPETVTVVPLRAGLLMDQEDYYDAEGGFEEQERIADSQIMYDMLKRKKTMKKEWLKQREHVVTVTHLPGYRGNDDLTAILNFVEGPPVARANLAAAKEKKPRKKTKAEKDTLVKSASLDENLLNITAKRSSEAEASVSSKTAYSKELEKEEDEVYSASLPVESCRVPLAPSSFSKPYSNVRKEDQKPSKTSKSDRKEELSTSKTPTTVRKDEISTTKPSTAVRKDDVIISKTPATVRKEEGTSSKPPATVRKEEVTTSKPAATVRKEDVTSNKTPAAVRKEEVTSNKTPAAVRKEEVTLSKPPATVRKEDVTTSKTPSTVRKEEVTTSKTPAPVHKEEVTTSKTPALIRKEEVSTSKPPAPVRKEEVTTSKTPAPFRKEEVSTSKTPAPVRKEEVSTSKTPASVRKEEVTTSKTPAPVRKEEISTSKNPTSVRREEISTIKTPIPVRKEEFGTSKTSAAVRKEEFSMSKTPAPVRKEEIGPSKNPTTIRKEETNKTSSAIRKEEVTTSKPPTNVRKEDFIAFKGPTSVRKDEDGSEGAFELVQSKKRKPKRTYTYTPTQRDTGSKMPSSPELAATPIVIPYQNGGSKIAFQDENEFPDIKSTLVDKNYNKVNSLYNNNSTLVKLTGSLKFVKEQEIIVNSVETNNSKNVEDIRKELTNSEEREVSGPSANHSSAVVTPEPLVVNGDSYHTERVAYPESSRTRGTSVSSQGTNVPVVFCGGNFEQEIPSGQDVGFEFGFGVLSAMEQNTNDTVLVDQEHEQLGEPVDQSDDGTSELATQYYYDEGLREPTEMDHFRVLGGPEAFNQTTYYDVPATTPPTLQTAVGIPVPFPVAVPVPYYCFPTYYPPNPPPYIPQTTEEIEDWMHKYVERVYGMQKQDNIRFYRVGDQPPPQ